MAKFNFVKDYFVFFVFLKYRIMHLQCFDAVGWTAGRAYGL